jgi:glucose dehydrogenase
MTKSTFGIFICFCAMSAGLAALTSGGEPGQGGQRDGGPPVSPDAWPVYDGGSSGDHYSSLSQINRENVHRLKVAWTFDTGDSGWLETNPLVVDNALYGVTAKGKVFALDATNGHLLWKFDSGVDGTQPVRGLSIWTDGKNSRLFVGIMNFLYCLDPLNGKPIASFGEKGRVDLRKGLRGEDYWNQSIVLTSPGIIYHDMIVVGGRNPETPPAPPGDIRAFDVHTGQLRWRFRTIPHPSEPGYETWPKDAWQAAGAANNWAGMALDERRGILYVPTGSAVPDFYGAERVGDDLFANSLLALDAATGKLIWHFQGVHHDLWDRDFPAPPALVTVARGGRKVDAVAQTTKQGWLFLFDRVTGKPLFPVHERQFPPSDVPGEVASPTQPVPELPMPYARQRLTEDMLTNRTPEAHAWALNEFRGFRNEGQFTPLSVGKQTVVFPGFDGGAEWGGPAVDPATGVVYVNANDIAATGGLSANESRSGIGALTYQNQCAVCHGDTRAGSPPTFPSLIGIDKRLSSEQIAKVIHTGSGRMPSFPSIDGEALNALMEYLRTGKEADRSSASSGDKESVHADHAGTSTVADPEAARIYANNCSVCHGDHQEGIPPGFPSLIGVESRLDAKQIESIIRKGKGQMPGLSPAQLSDEGIQKLLQYLDDRRTVPHPVDEYAYVKYRFTGYRKFYDPDGYPAVAPPWGTLSAIDLNSGRYLWQIPLGEYPELSARGVPLTGTENYGGPIVTAGGLVFIGATIFDRKFRAFDSQTGKLLWEAELPYAGLATPATYMIKGRQFVVIAAGGGRDPKWPNGGAYVAFTLR